MHAPDADAAANDGQLQDSSSPKAWQRFYMGYKERFVDDCCIQLANGKVVRLAQAASANALNKQRSQQLDRNADPALTGTTVWDGAVVLSQYLTAQPGLLQKQDGSRPISLELGAGTGAVSLCLLASDVVQRAIITDIPDMVPHLQQNLYHNNAVLDPSQAIVRSLCWGEAADIAGLQPYQPPVDVIVGSDLIYYSYSLATPQSRLLLMALQQLAGPETQIYLALSLHHNPQEVENFLRWSQETWGFSVKRIKEGMPMEYRVPDVLIVCMQLVDITAAANAGCSSQVWDIGQGLLMAMIENASSLQQQQQSKTWWTLSQCRVLLSLCQTCRVSLTRLRPVIAVHNHCVIAIAHGQVHHGQ